MLDEYGQEIDSNEMDDSLVEDGFIVAGDYFSDTSLDDEEYDAFGNKMSIS